MSRGRGRPSCRRTWRGPAAAAAHAAADVALCHNLSLWPVKRAITFQLGSFDLSDYVSGGTVIYRDARTGQVTLKLFLK